MTNQLILFGAGASFGSEPEGMPTPPLLKNLCQELANSFPDIWGRFFRNERKRFGKGFEKEMLWFVEHVHTYDGIKNFPMRMQWDLAKFLFEFEPSDHSHYVKIANVLKSLDWKGTITTLNYDRLLEIALRRVKTPFFKYAVGGQSDGLEILFPHGCSNLCVAGELTFTDCVVTGNPLQGGVVIDYAPVTVENIEEFEEHLQKGGNIAQPVMAFIEPGKGCASSPSFFENTSKRFEECVLAAEQIIIIGVNCNEQDDHIWGPLKETNAEINYCSGTDVSSFDKWCSENHRTNVTNLRKNWADAFDEICNILAAN